MIINFSDIRFKQVPAGNNGMSLSLTCSDPILPVPTERRSARIDTDKLTRDELKVLSDFITMIKSKL
jgi:hypothetical protein